MNWILLVSSIAAFWHYSKGDMVAKCLPGWDTHYGSDECYTMPEEGWIKTFVQAREFCQGRGGDTLVIKYPHTLDWVLSIMKDMGPNEVVYMNAKKIEGKWIWTEDQTDVNLELIPLDSQTKGDCGTLTKDGKLFGVDCNEEHVFMCHRGIDVPPPCDYLSDWEQMFDHCYKISREEKIWTEALVDCRADTDDNSLIIINNEAEQQFAKDISHHRDSFVWIGISEMDHPGSFQWSNGDSNYTKWQPDEPSMEYNGTGAGALDKENPEGSWKVLDGSTQAHDYICEKPQGACVYGWESFGDSCYYFNAEKTDTYVWQNANDTCAEVGAYLLIIDDEEENVFISDHMAEDDVLWMGLRSKPHDDIYWIDHTKMNFTHMTDEDKQAALESKDEMCVYYHIIDTATGETAWTPTDCYSPRHYICEVKQGEPIKLIHHHSKKYCPEGWLKYDDRCYFLGEEEKIWTDAQNYCRDKQGDLISINSWAEQDFVHCNIDNNIWIGYSDRDTEGTWLWNDGTEGIGVNNWDVDEPNGGSSENCGSMYLSDGQWNDYYCTRTNNIACERAASDTPFVDVSTTTENPYSENCQGYDWVENPNTGECYYVSLSEYPFDQADTECYWKDSTLLSLSTAEESEFVIGMLQQLHSSVQTFSIGLRNEPVEGLFWKDGSPVGFFNWADGEPNSLGADPCVEMYTQEGTWNDEDCSKVQAFVCEKKGLNYKPVQPPPPPEPRCPDGWTNFNFHCYYLYETKVSWNTGEAWCESHMNSSLASIMEEAENDFIYGMAREADIDVWIGLHDDGSGSNWYWADGSNFDEYKNWNDTQPDDVGGNEHCGHLSRELGGRWSNIPCDENQGAICKIILDVCPLGWRYHDRKCYFASDIPGDYDAARKGCKEFNEKADLVTIRNEEENSYFADIMPHGPLSVWIGYNYDTEKQSWYWDDGSQSNFTLWNSGEPNNMEEELCTEVIDAPDFYAYRYWNNLKCSETRNYGCEYFPKHGLGCEENWMEFGDYCYFFENVYQYEYDQIHDLCANMDAQVVSIHSQEENDFLCANTYNNIWLGFSDIVHKGSVIWDDGTTFTFSNWEMFSDVGIVEPMCAQFVYYTYGGWSLFPCYTWGNYVCKKPKQVQEIKPIETGCRDEDFYYKGSCYTIPPTDPFIWDHAQTSCEDNGAHLLRIEDEYESAFFSAYLGDFGSDAWTDVKVHRYTDESVDFRFDNGNLAHYLPWDKDEPDLNKGECILITGTPGHSGFYRIATCDTPMQYICEYDRADYTTPLPPVTPTHSTFCYDGWTNDNGYCYKVFEETKTWRESEAHCLSYGGHLTSINNPNEEYEISMLIMYVTGSSFWVGLELNTLADKRWTDGSSIDYLHWSEGQPEMHDHENCASVEQYSATLSCSVCESHLPFVCKAPEGTMFTTVTPPTISPPGKCDDGEGDWYLFKDHCYKFVSEVSEEPQSWEKSRKLCREEGSYLTSVNDIDENYFIESMIQLHSDDGFWLGGRAMDDYGFSWTDGSPFNYESWYEGEPNHYLDQEDCIEMYNRKMGKWNDKNCGHLTGRVCKRPNGATIPTPAPTLPPAGNCPRDWIHVVPTGRCFKFVESYSAIDEVSQACKNLHPSADAVSLHKMVEMAYITAGVGALRANAWLGLKFEMDDYVWIDQSVVDYTPWAPGEPNGQYYGEDCVQAIYPAGQMADVTCWDYTNYICAMDQDPNIEKSDHLPRCEPPLGNYYSYDGECFNVGKQAKTWKEAEEACASDGAHLASVHNINENAYVWLLAMDQGVLDPWIGLNNLRDSRLYSWSDGWPMIYSEWGEDQPMVNATDNNCVRIKSDDGYWYNGKCDEQRPFVCKYPNGTAPSPGPPAPGHCRDETWFDFNNGFCYSIVQETKSFSEAMLHCSMIDSNLTSIHSAMETEYLKKATHHLQGTAWIGLIQKSTGLGWFDSTPFDFVNWHDGEPSTEAEQCTEFYTEDGTWNDIDCYNLRPFICKTPKIPDIEPTDATIPPFITTTNKPGGGGGLLSGGAIFGIIISLLLVVAAVGFVGVSYIKKKQANNNSFSPISPVSVKMDLPVVDIGSDA